MCQIYGFKVPTVGGVVTSYLAGTRAHSHCRGLHAKPTTCFDSAEVCSAKIAVAADFHRANL